MKIPHAERITSSRFLPPWLGREHEARYAFCRPVVTRKRVLDCGSGEGRGSLSIAQGDPELLLALDVSVAAVSMLHGQNTRVKALAGSAESLPFQPRSFDVVISLEVIEHFERPHVFLREVASVLRPEGVFICSTPNRIVRNPMSTVSDKPLNPWHLREWTPQEFRRLLEGAFERVEFYGQQPQKQGVTRFFDLFGRIWKRGAAILRQLAKFKLLLSEPADTYVVQPLDERRDFEFLVCRCYGPRPQRHPLGRTT